MVKHFGDTLYLCFGIAEGQLLIFFIFCHAGSFYEKLNPIRYMCCLSFKIVLQLLDLSLIAYSSLDLW